MDEFTVNTRGLSFRGWARKGDKGYLKVDSKDFCMTFIWSLSAKRVYGIMGSDRTIISVEVKHYIWDLSESRKYFEMTMIRILSWCLIMQECTQASRQINSSHAPN